MAFFDFLFNRDRFSTNVDPKLKTLLRARGMEQKIVELEKNAQESGVVRQFGRDIKKKSFQFLDATKTFGTELGGDIGRAGLQFTKEGKKLDEIASGQYIDPQLKQRIMNSQRKRELTKLLNEGQITPNEYLDITTKNRTPQQVLADAGMLMLTVGTIGRFKGVPNSITGKLAIGGNKAAQALKASRAVENLGQGAKALTFAEKLAGRAKVMGRDAILGGVFGTLSAQSQGKSVEETAKEAGGFAAFSAALPPVLGVAMKSVAKTVGAANIFVMKPVYNKVIQGLEKIAGGNIPKEAKTATELIGSIFKNEDSLMQKFAKTALRADKTIRSLPQKLIDRFYPLGRMESRLSEALGRPLTDDERVFMQARQVDAMVAGKGDDFVERFSSDFIEQYHDILDQAKRYIGIKDIINRSELGQVQALKGSTNDLKTLLSEYEAELGDILPRVQEAQKTFNGFTKELLDYMVDAKVISQDFKDNLIAKYPDYFPHNVIVDVFEDVDSRFGVSKSLNVSKLPFKEAKGSERMLEDPLSALMSRIPGIYYAGEKNKVLLNLIDIYKNPAIKDSVIPELMPLRTAEQVKERMVVLDKLKILKNELSNLTKEGKATGKIESATVKKIALLEGQINKLDDGIVRDVNEFLMEGDEIAKISKIDKRVVKVPLQFSEQASQIKRMSKEEFLQSNILLKEFEDGTLERFGYKTRDEFYDAVKAGVQESGGNEYIEAAKNQLSRARESLRKRTLVSEKLSTTQEVELPSVQDSVRFIEDQINEITAKKKEFLDEIKSLREVQMSPLKMKENGLEMISLFRDGVREKWVVPSDIGIAIKNLDADQVGFLEKIAAKPANALRAGATKYNLSFTLPNWFRDLQTATTTSEISVDSLLTSLANTNEKKALLKAYKDSGGLLSDIFSEYKNPADVVKKFEQTSWIAKIKNNINPLKAIDHLNESVEMSTRLNVFREALIRGMTPRQAAFEARNATIDFSKMGTVMRKVNRIIPFLNARVQGAINVGKAFAKTPERFVRAQMWTAAYPTFVLNQHNSGFESYQNIPDYIKARYWVMMVGEVPGKDDNGNEIMIPQFATIPKGEAQQLISNPIQFFLERSQGIDNRSVQEMVTDVVGSFSPIAFQTFSSNNVAMSLLAQGGPLATIPVGIATGIDPFLGREIIPESKQKATDISLQTRSSTPESVKTLSDIINKGSSGTVKIAPAMLEFVINSFGGLPQDITKGIDYATQGKPESLSGTKFGTAANTPLLRRFMREAGEFGSPEFQANMELRQELEGDMANRNIELSNQANEILDEAFKLDNRRAINDFITKKVKEAGDTPALKKKLKALIKYRQTVDTLTKNDPVELRARFIFQKFQELYTKSERMEYAKELEAAGIITDDVKKYLKALKDGRIQ